MSAPLLPSSFVHTINAHNKSDIRARHRTTVLALLTLVLLSCYILFITNPSLSAVSRFRPPHDMDVLDTPANTSVPMLKPHPIYQPVLPPSPQLSLTPEEELAGLAAFLAALPHNRLPPSVNPNEPLDPQLILDFDTSGDSAREELDKVIEEVWTRHPVMLFAKLHSAHSRELRGMLAKMNLKPSPLVFEVDQREDAPVLIPLLTRLTGVPTMPVLLIGGRPVGAGTHNLDSLMDQIQKLEKSGELSIMILQAGASVNQKDQRGR